MIHPFCIGALLFAGFTEVLMANTLNLPPRPPDALGGSEIIDTIAPLSLEEREKFIIEEIASGNVPNFIRQLIPVTVNEGDYHSTYFVTPDYLALGSDLDYFITPMTPLTAQWIADRLDCTLPTPKMVDQIWSEATLKLAPTPIPPGPAMTTVTVFAEHNTKVRKQRHAAAERFPLGTLIAGTKKDVVISRRIYGDFANRAVTQPVVIYGWHRADGTPIQPLYNGHAQTYADYSHGIRLIQNSMILNGEPAQVPEVLQSPTLAPLLSDEGPLPIPRYPKPAHNYE